jgi:Zn-dependent peptidase ImmA (M78 family)
MKPEEKLADRLLERHNLAPPYDLEKLVLLYADIDYLEFPVEADGISLGLKKIDKPKIYINSKRHLVRQRFTLAHELGHVIIPWHTGNIISHNTNFSVYEENGDVVTNFNSREDYDYRQIESEANRFAAELLLPTTWLLKYCQEVSTFNFKEALVNVIQESQSSRDTTLI